MQYIKSIHRRNNCDIGYTNNNLEPLNNIGRVGKSGIDKNLSFEKIIEFAYEINANIIVKAGKNAKWYLKKFPINNIEDEIAKQKWRDTSRATIWIIEWDKNSFENKNTKNTKNTKKIDYFNNKDYPHWLLDAEIIMKQQLNII
jgi:hypothetical protein